jgi:hypothetical protein
MGRVKQTQEETYQIKLMFVGDQRTRSFQGTLCLYKNKASARNKIVPVRTQALCLCGTKAVKYGVIHQCHDPAYPTHCISSGERTESMWRPKDLLPSDGFKRISGLQARNWEHGVFGIREGLERIYLM